MSNGLDSVFPMRGVFDGLAKRELFAAIALHGYLSGRSADARGATRETVAVGCVAYADALLAELEKKVPNV